MKMEEEKQKEQLSNVTKPQYLIPQQFIDVAKGIGVPDSETSSVLAVEYYLELRKELDNLEDLQDDDSIERYQIERYQEIANDIVEIEHNLCPRLARVWLDEMS